MSRPDGQNLGENGQTNLQCRAEMEKADANLQTMNRELLTLAEIFPGIQREVFREMLMSFSVESRLHVITEALIARQTQFAAGRWEKNTSTSVKVPKRELFRRDDYKASAKKALYEEFPGLRHSTVKGVLAEKNWSYSDSRPILAGLSARTWRTSLRNLLFPRRAVVPLQHPLIMTCSAPNLNTPLISTRPGLDWELAEEVYAEVVAPMVATRLEQQLCVDLEVAEQINEEEAEATQNMYDCECCFTATTWERVGFCGKDHPICFRCIKLTMSEALYGQGWAQSVDNDRCTLRCVAVSSRSNGPCSSWIPSELMRAALRTSRDGRDMLARFEQRIAEECLAVLGSKVLQCPHCAYAEAPLQNDRIAGTSFHVIAQHRPWILLGVTLIPVLDPFSPSRLLKILNFVLVLLVVLALLHRGQRHHPAPPDPTPTKYSERTDRGSKFVCRASQCSRVSCLNCNADWEDPHTCFSESTSSLRTFIEAAVTAAIKRTCPQCGTSFVKSSGCNKLVCPCGYAMCYICRADVRTEKYNHFCPHFRPNAGSCPECDRCDLYKEEDEERIIREAKQEAEKEWWEMEREKKLFKDPKRADQLLGKMRATVDRDGTSSMIEDAHTKARRRWRLGG